MVITLLVDRARLPNLDVDMEGLNLVNEYPIMGKWRFVRFIVTNKKMPFFLRWLPRAVAQNCSANIEFFHEETNSSIFKMRGRWASTPEIPQVAPSSFIERTFYPDPISIFSGEKEALDCVAQKEGDGDAYGWNNEAYLNNWKTARYKLSQGVCKIKVTVMAQNGVSIVKWFKLNVDGNFLNTQLQPFLKNQLDKAGEVKNGILKKWKTYSPVKEKEACFLNNSKKIETFAHLATVVIAAFAIIGFIASSMQFRDTLENSNKQFELMNRPFIEITVLPIAMAGVALGRGALPEIAFTIESRFINHGKLPAFIKKVDCLFESIDEKEICIAMPYPGDMERQIGNIDVFPYICDQYVQRINISPLINTNDIKRIMKIEDSFAIHIADKKSEFWTKDYNEIKKETIKHIKPFFVILQIEYYKMGDNKTNAKPYYYSLKVKAIPEINSISFYKSISGESETSGKWFKVYEDGSIKKI